MARRLWWESVELPRVLRQDRGDALLNLTNSGPLRSPVPSILYQRNALWFDPSCARAFRGRARVAAAARRQLVYLQMRGSAVTIVPSAAMAGFLMGRRGTPGAPAIRVIPHAVDTERFTRPRRTWPPADRPIRMVSVGHAAPHKDQALLVQLVARLRDQGLDAHLSLTIERDDSPSYVDEIQRERRRLAVEDRVELLGRVAGVERLYRDADVMLFPSLSESFGFPIVEAMASGLPVVSSAIPASEELLGGDGWLFPPGDVDAAASAVHRLMGTSSHDMTEITARAAHAARAYGWSANAVRIAATVESALGLRPPDPDVPDRPTA
ncbi:glycosyltransferase [Iamia sp.]|uniref:glycosyltransferase family 4 protein n=1 Tax=Iamia sp. TaxID=2722710 RepID=UPI002BEBE3A4|nr:glycosyltransferase [Iamia sp.]HXH55737.1 glycosyltransferase [Iamia sp.]